MEIERNLLQTTPKPKIFDQFRDVETDKRQPVKPPHAVRIPVQKQLTKPLKTYLDTASYEAFCSCCETIGLKPAAVMRQLVLQYIKEHTKGE